MTDKDLTDYKQYPDASGGLRAFDFKSMIPKDKKKTMRMAFYGKTNCGKSHCIKSILYEMQSRFNTVYLFSATASLQEDTYDYVPKSNKIETLDIEFMNKVMDSQRDQKMRNPKKLEHILFIIDDMISENAIRSDKTIMKLFVQGRHFGISVFVTSQVVGSTVSIPPQIRNNCEYIVSFSLFSEPDRNILIERFGSLTSKKEGVDFFKRITQDKYCACIFDTTQTQATKLEDMMFSYKAPENVPKYVMGKEQLRAQPNAEFVEKQGRKKKGLDLNFEDKSGMSLEIDY